MVITRRFKPEVSNGIGNWMNALEILSTLSIFFNCLFIYFTSSTYQHLFLGKPHDGSQTAEALKETGKGFEMPTLSLDTLKFFMVLVAVEHLIIVIQLGYRNSKQLEPKIIIQGTADRKYIIQEHQRKLRDIMEKQGNS